MPTTLKDIAIAANVSIGTVDRALKNRGRINPEVAERIRNLAEEMGYHPNKIASGLSKRSRKYKFAVILHITGNDFFDEVLKGVKKGEREIRDYGMSIRIYPCEDFNAKVQLSNIEKAIEDGANAIIIVPINSPMIGKKIRQLQKESFPIVFLNTYLNRISPLASIHCDYYRSGRMGAMLINLISNSCGHVMAFFPSAVMLGNNTRKEGCEAYFKSTPPSLVLDKTVELTNNSDINQAIMLEELTNHPQVDYILFCGDAKCALSVLDSINRPIKAVFYDLSDETNHALKTGKISAAIGQTSKEQGYQAVNILFQYFITEKTPPKEIIMDSQIIFKECID